MDKHLERVLYICLSKDGLYPITVTVMVFPSPDASSIAANVGARVSHPLWCDRTTMLFTRCSTLFLFLQKILLFLLQNNKKII
ncbi:unnamed protein product [Camellia sinensis]